MLTGCPFLSVIQASGALSVIAIAQAHGGWLAIELRRRLEQRPFVRALDLLHLFSLHEKLFP
jgi:hypothetical protein